MSGITGGPADGSGWFHDPAGSANLRWWDGAAWTDYLIDPATGVAPVEAQPVAPQPAPVQPIAAQPVPVQPVSPQPPIAQPLAPQPFTRRELREQEAAAVAPASSPPSAVPVVFEPAAAAPVVFQPGPTPIVFEPAPAPPSSVPFVWGLNGTEQNAATAPVATFEQLMAASAPDASASTVSIPQAAAPQSSIQQASIPQASIPQPVAPQSFGTGVPVFEPSIPTATYPQVGPGSSQPWIASPPPPQSDLYALRIEDPTYEPMVRSRQPADADQDRRTGSSSTTAIWIYAALPLLHLALAWFVYAQLKPADDTGIRWVVLLGPIVLYLILATIDRTRLIAYGHSTAPSPVFALIPPLYIGIRAARLGIGAILPAAFWFVLQAGTLLVLVVVFPTVASQLTAETSVTPAATTSAASGVPLSDKQRAIDLTPIGMAAKITSDFAAIKTIFTSVSCPQLVNVYDGAQTVCVATLAGGTENLNVSVSASDLHTAFHVVGVGALIPNS